MARIATRRGMYAPNGLLTNLVGYWPLNESSGTADALDLHSGGKTFAYNANSGPGVATTDTGLVYPIARKSAWRADSAANLTRTDAALQPTTHTWAIWFYALSYPLGEAGHFYHNLLSCNDGDSGDNILLTASQQIAYQATDTDLHTHAAHYDGVTLNAWHLAICWYSANAIYARVDDGEPVSEAMNGYRNGNWKGNPVHIGANLISDADAWDGRIGPIALWNRALTNAQMTALYNQGKGLSYDRFT